MEMDPWLTVWNKIFLQVLVVFLLERNDRLAVYDLAKIHCLDISSLYEHPSLSKLQSHSMFSVCKTTDIAPIVHIE